MCNISNYQENITVILCQKEEPDVKLSEIKSKKMNMIDFYGGNAYLDYPQWAGGLIET